MSGILRKAYRDLTKRKLRSLLTVAGIVIGVAGIVAIVSTSRNLVRAQEAAYRNASQADVTYWTWNAPSTLKRALEAIPNVAQAELRTALYTKWQVSGVWRDLYLVGIQDFGQVRINKMALREGRYPGLDELLVEASVREITPLAVGQEIAVRDRFGQERYFTVSGFAQSPAFLSSALTNFAVAYAPATQVRRMVGIAGSNQVLIKLADFRQKDETLQDIQRLFAKRGLQHGEPQVRDPINYLGKRELDALMWVMFLFSTLGLALSGFLVANTLSAIAAEQVSEMGVMKAIGGTRAQVLGIYLLSAALYGLVGTALGLTLGAVGGWQLLAYIGRLGNVEVAFQIAPEGLALGVLVGLGVTLAAGFPPAWAGTAISVKEALDTYGITSTYGQGRLDRLLQRISALPPVAAMAVRNLARRKARNTVTLLVIAFATAGLLAAQSTDASVACAIEDVFATYNADAWMWFAEPVGQEFAGMIRAVPEVQEVEAWSLADARIKHRRARLWGLPADSTLYNEVMQAGRWYRPGENDAIVVSADLAADRDIHVGDVIEVEVGEEGRSFRVVGVAVDNSIFLGATIAGKVFAPVEAVGRLRRRQGLADLFALRLQSSDPGAVDEALARLERRFRRLRPATESAHSDMAAAQRPARLLSLALYVMVLLVALIGAIGVLNTLTLNVLERRREIGVMRAIGARDLNLVQAFLTEGLSLGLAGWALGLALGYPLGRLFVRLMERVLFHIEFVFAPSLLLTSFLFAVALVALASLGPALGAARLPAAEALRYE